MLKEILPVTGKSGTLRKRLLDTPAEGRVKGKTGSLNGVISLAGTVDTIFDRSLSFAFVTNFDGERNSQLASLDQKTPVSLSHKGVLFPFGVLQTFKLERNFRVFD